MHRHALGLTVASTAPLGQWGPRRPKPRAKCLLVDLDETLYATPALIKGVPDRIHRECPDHGGPAAWVATAGHDGVGMHCPADRRRPHAEPAPRTVA